MRRPRLRSSQPSYLHRLVIGAVLLFGFGSDAFAASVLQRVIIVERHGVRAPNDPPDKLFKYSYQHWPEWLVGPGELTPHGASGLVNMGRALRKYYADRGLLPATGCASDIYVWSDGKYQRTMASGDAVGRGLNMVGNCQTNVRHGKAFETDPLFDPIGAKVCPVDAKKAQTSVALRLNETLKSNAAAYALARTTLQSILTPGWKDCGPNDNRKECLIAGGVNTVGPGGSLDGPLANGSTVGEDILLEYGQGFAPQQVGWGRAPFDKIVAFMPLHNLFSTVTRSDPYIASRRGSALMQEILDALRNVPSTFKGSVPIPKGTRLMLFLGHDTNLANLAGVLGKQWTLPGQPDNTGPGAAMAFELWSIDGKPQVAVRMLYPTLGQLRTLAPVSLVEPVPLAVTCLPGRPCSPDELQARLDPVLAKDCLKPQ